MDESSSAEAVNPTNTVEEVSELGSPAKRWQIEIELAEKERRSWVDRAEKVVKRYRDERGDYDKRVKFNILWSNVQTLLPAIYAQTPKPEVERRFLDDDHVGRSSSEILQRATAFYLENYNFDRVMRSCVEDLLLPGLGALWVRYEPHMRQASERVPLNRYVEEEGVSVTMSADEWEEAGYEDGDDRYTGPDGAPMPKERVLSDEQGAYAEEQYEELEYQEVETDYVYWQDFLFSPARVWDEVRWVARRVYLTRAEGRERFGKQFNLVPLNYRPKGMPEDSRASPEHEAMKKAIVWEIWCRNSKKVYWIVPGYDRCLDERDDPLELEGFFPCPEPLLATTTNGTLIPVPDYCEYQDQADELDDLTYRISKLLDAMKVAGVYDASQDQLKRIFEEGADNQLIPVDTWAAFAEKGGIKGTIDFVPIGDVANVLEQLYTARERCKQIIYEITGIADIVRGASNPNETATAQRIKGQFATLRLSDRQKSVARFARDTIRIMAEIIAEQWEPDTLMQVSGIKLPTRAEVMQQYQQAQMQYQQQAMQAQMQAQQTGQPPQIPPPPQPPQTVTIDDVVDLLRNEDRRNWRIDIEADSTVAADQEAEQQARMEFVQGMTGMMEKLVPMAMQMPQIAPVLTQSMSFALRAFTKGRVMQSQFDDAMKGIEQAAMAPKPPQADPKQQAMQAQQQMDQARLQLEQQKAGQQMQIEQQKAEASAQLEQYKAQMAASLERQRMEFEAKMREMEAMLDARIKMANHDQESMLRDETARAERAKAQAEII